MLSYQVSGKLGALLLSVSAGEQEIEKYRQNVCKFKDLEPYAAYQRIERRQGGFITAKGIVNFLADNKIYYSEEQCGIFINRFDLDRDQELSFSEFLNALLPFENPLLRTTTSQRANYRVTVKQYLPTKIEEALAQLIDKEIAFYLNLDLQKARLVQQKDFSFEAAFDTIDKYSNERIDYDNLMIFFRGQAMYPDKKDVIAILRRIDREDKGYIFLKELVAELQPLTYTAMKTTRKAELSHREQQQLGQSVQMQNSLLLSERERERDVVVVSTRTVPNQEFLSPVKDGKNTERDQRNMSAASTAFGTTMKSKEPINVVDEAESVEPMEAVEQVEVKKKLKFGGPTSGEIGFISILRQILSFTKELENAKDELAAQPDWNIFAFFGSFKPERRVYLTESHLIEGLKKYGVFPNKDELRLLFSSLDKDRDDIIGQRDFEDLLLPLNYELSIAVRNRGPFFKDTHLAVDRLFSLDTRRKINKVMSLCLENEGIFENLRRTLHNTTTFEARDAFDKVDIKNEGFVSSEALEDFLKAYDWHPTQREINCLMSALDLNKDGRISYVEFAHTLTPRSLL